MSSLNRVTLVGRLGGEVEHRQTSNGSSVGNFTVATSESYTKDGEKKEKTEWPRDRDWETETTN